MAQSGDFILVCFLDDEPVGKTWERSRRQWPLHVTLVPWFGSADGTTLVSALEAVAQRHEQFIVTLGEPEQFNENTTVNVLADQTAVQQLHEDLLNTVETLGVQLTSTQWVRDAYKAHVTHHDGMRTPTTGELVDITNFSLVALQPMNQCKIIQHFNLGSKV